MVSIKFFYTFVSGFFLAVFLFSLGIFLYAVPQLDSMQEALEVTELIYDSTNSSEFDSVLALINLASEGEGIPFIGNYLGDLGNLNDVLLAAKDLSGPAKQNIEFIIFITNISQYFVITSFVAFFIATILAFMPVKKVLKE